MPTRQINQARLIYAGGGCPHCTHKYATPADFPADLDDDLMRRWLRTTATTDSPFRLVAHVDLDAKALTRSIEPCPFVACPQRHTNPPCSS